MRAMAIQLADKVKTDTHVSREPVISYEGVQESFSLNPSEWPTIDCNEHRSADTWRAFLGLLKRCGATFEEDYIFVDC